MNFTGKFIISELRETIFEVRHYLSKTLQLFTKSTGSASEWFLSTISLLLVGLFPTVGHTKKAVIPTPGLFIERNYAVSFNNLCRKYREPDLHCINKKNPGYPHFLEKKKQQQQQQPAILFHAKLWTFPADFLGADGSR